MSSNSEGVITAAVVESGDRGSGYDLKLCSRSQY